MTKKASPVRVQTVEAVEAPKPVAELPKIDATHENVANVHADKSNDPFIALASIDVGALQDGALEAMQQGNRAARREGQMQIANILARYAQDLLLGDANPENLYKVEAGKTKLNSKCVTAIARVIYGVPEKNPFTNEKQKLDKALENRVRNYANVVFYCVQQRIPLVYDAQSEALVVPTFMMVADKNMRETFEEKPEARSTFNKPTLLDGKEGRSLQALIDRTPNPAKAKRDSDDSTAQTEAEKAEEKTKKLIKALGVSKVVALLVDMVSALPASSALADDIVDHIAVLTEQVVARNGKDSLGKAVESLRKVG